MKQLADEDFARILEWRTNLRRFLRWSEDQAESVGLTAAQHQLLVAIRGHGDPRGPTVGEIAGYLLLRPHSAVELVDRAEAAGLVARHRNDPDGRVVRVVLTPRGIERLNQLTDTHIDELRRLSTTLKTLVEKLDRHYGAERSR